MPDVVIENPVINSPYEEPRRHFVFADDGITDQIAETRRLSSYFVPIPPPKKKGGQQSLPGDWLGERMRTNDFINRVRSSVGRWRQGGYQGVTPVTRALLEYWNDPERERRLFFCQIEALETAIYAAEVAPRYGDTWIENSLRRSNESANPGLYRLAFKMATGSGKTVVMAMLIAWQALNKLANPQDRRFGDSFLVVTPGITIRDRLRVLLPNDPDNYYVERDLVTADQLVQLQQAKILITKYHSFLRRDKLQAASLTKKVLAGPDGSLEAFKETPDEMARRVCRAFASKKGVIVINDEAHHCYREKPDAEQPGHERPAGGCEHAGKARRRADQDRTGAGPRRDAGRGRRQGQPEPFVRSVTVGVTRIASGRAGTHSAGELPLRGDRDLEQARRLLLVRDGLARGHQVLQAELDRLAGIGYALLDGLALRNASGESRDGHGEAAVWIRNGDHRVGPHHSRGLSEGRRRRVGRVRC